MKRLYWMMFDQDLTNIMSSLEDSIKALEEAVQELCLHFMVLEVD